MVVKSFHVLTATFKVCYAEPIWGIDLPWSTPLAFKLQLAQNDTANFCQFIVPATWVTIEDILFNKVTGNEMGLINCMQFSLHDCSVLKVWYWWILVRIFPVWTQCTWNKKTGAITSTIAYTWRYRISCEIVSEGCWGAGFNKVVCLLWNLLIKAWLTIVNYMITRPNYIRVSCVVSVVNQANHGRIHIQFLVVQDWKIFSKVASDSLNT